MAMAANRGAKGEFLRRLVCCQKSLFCVLEHIAQRFKEELHDIINNHKLSISPCSMAVY